MSLLTSVDVSAVPVIGFSKRMVFPGQDVVRSRYTGQVQVVGRGPGHWAGSITWLPAERAHIDALSVLFACLEGEANSVDLTLPASRYASTHQHGAGHRASTTGAGTIANGVLTVPVQKDAGSGAIQVATGGHVNIGARLYQCVHGVIFLTTANMQVVPVARPASGATLTINAPFVRVRAALSDQGLISHVGHVNDPVVLDWEEIV